MVVSPVGTDNWVRGGVDATPEVRNEYNVRPEVFAQFIDQFKGSGVRVLTMQQALVETTTIAG